MINKTFPLNSEINFMINVTHPKICLISAIVWELLQTTVDDPQSLYVNKCMTEIVKRYYQKDGLRINIFIS